MSIQNETKLHLLKNNYILYQATLRYSTHKDSCVCRTLCRTQPYLCEETLGWMYSYLLYMHFRSQIPLAFYTDDILFRGYLGYVFTSASWDQWLEQLGNSTIM